jgi:hypothetical protein
MDGRGAYLRARSVMVMVADDEVCEWSELNVDECPHCTGDLSGIAEDRGPEFEPRPCGPDYRKRLSERADD